MKAKYIFIGVIIGLILPLLIDWLLFGSVTPCHTIKKFEDGSSIQACTVKESK